MGLVVVFLRPLGLRLRRGRASYVGEVARGVVDPGAAAAALMLACAAHAAGGSIGPAAFRFD
ncbi:hypothetical protein GCM10023147_50150 [Tsukamurella soli]|uniref:DhaL domain-containing protein n=1 Tax=Tsukamurella soli TaxID=644556 RepID=A0ABP8KG94_9ACTN